MGAVPKTCVLRIPTARVTNEETEAFHQGGRETLRPRSHVMQGPCDHKGPPRPALLAGSRFSLQRG
jgi:hypothetical protein